jgi:hypothetical protein
MSKFAVVCETCTSVQEVNATQHEITFVAFLIDSTIDFRGSITCYTVIDASDNSNKVREAYIQGVIAGAAAVGSTLAQGDIITHQFFRAP